MKKLLFAFLLLLFAVWLGFLIHRDPGYVLITYRSWSIEASLWVGLLILLIAFIIFYIVIRLFRHTAQLSVSFQLWNKERRERKAGELTNQAFNALIEMEWQSAENLFSKSAKNSTCCVINYSAAAYAAQQLQALDRRNKYLTKLAKQVPSANKAAKLMESYFYIQSDQWKDALTLLHQLRKKYPQDHAVMHFLVKALEGIGDWQSLKKLLPAFKKMITHANYKALASRIYTKLLKKAIHPEWLDEAWEEIPKPQRTNTQIALAYVIKAMELRRDNKAVSVIEEALKKNWDAMLVDYYGKLKSDYTNKQINHAESWLKKYPDEPKLLICLGRLCLREKRWDKAREHLDKALNIAAYPEVYCELGRLYEATDNVKAALENYRKALSSH